MSHARILIGDNSGKLIEEITPDIGSISWRISNIGKLSFTIAKTDPKAIESNLRYGNRVIAQFDNGLPDWGGVIDPPRTWDGNKIQIAAYSGEYLFQYRITDRGRYFTDQTVGEIFTALIDDANERQATGVLIGEVYDGGADHSPDYHFKSLLEIFQKSLCERISNYEFNVTPVLAGGVIKFYANLYERMGSDKVDLGLIQGQNLTPMKLNEQGPIVNSWWIAGEGTSWGEERLIASAEDITSIDLYGLREDSQIQAGVKDQTTLDNNAATLLEAWKSPKRIFSISTIDQDPARFGDYDIGDRLGLLAPDFGFGGTDTTVRILAREYQSSSEACVLVVEED